VAKNLILDRNLNLCVLLFFTSMLLRRQ